MRRRTVDQTPGLENTIATSRVKRGANQTYTANFRCKLRIHDLKVAGAYPGATCDPDPGEVGRPDVIASPSRGTSPARWPNASARVGRANFTPQEAAEDATDAALASESETPEGALRNAQYRLGLTQYAPMSAAVLKLPQSL